MTCVERHHKDPHRFLTGSKDSTIGIWRFDETKDFIVEYESGIEPYQFNQSAFLRLGKVTAAKWYDENSVIVALTDGSVQLKDVSVNKKDKCLEVYKTDCSINDMVIWISKQGLRVIVAEDSGKVKIFDPANTS